MWACIGGSRIGKQLVECETEVIAVDKVGSDDYPVVVESAQ
jgi:hypothetical protein